jgi:tRNA nucleotidyltransferase/poly(A) polymerase
MNNSLQQVVLSTSEAELFQIFLGTLQFKNRETTTLRVAGGWVRDKLLGRSSDDIDIAIDDQTGVEFATSVNEYLESINIPSNRLAVIMANPDQSKHMETATLKVLGLPIDFVNLRSETYSEDSRIPGIKFGTALDDSLRRDFTINSLFYNINKNIIEDLTNYGINDLITGIIRTPLDPIVTFKDDPLRILRAIRFSSRYNFYLDHNLVNASRNIDVQYMFEHKVSRERILKELDGMICHNTMRPLLALRSILYLGLYHLVFRINIASLTLESQLLLPPDQSEGVVAMIRTGYFIFPENQQQQQQQQIYDFLSSHKWTHSSIDIATWYNSLMILRKQLHISNLNSNNNIFNEISTTQQTEALDASTHPFSIPIKENEINSINIHTTTYRNIYLAAAVSGLRCFKIIEKNKNLPLYYTTLRDSLKLDTEGLRVVQIVLESIPQFQDFASRLIPSTGTGTGASDVGISRVEVGILLRSTKHLWKEILWLACSEQLASLDPQTYVVPFTTTTTTTLTSESTESASIETVVNSVLSASTSASVQAPSPSPTPSTSTSTSVTPHGMMQIMSSSNISTISNNIINQYLYLEQTIINFNLYDVWNLKPLLDGNQLMNAIGLKRGPMVGKIMESQLHWQLQYPPSTANNMEEYVNACAMYLKTVLDSSASS